MARFSGSSFSFVKSLIFSYLFFLIGTGFSFRTQAQVESPQTFTLDGKFYQSGTSNPLVDSSINVRIQILNHDKTCLLYEESQVVDTSTSAGNFSIQVGSEVGAGKRTVNDPGLAMSNIVQNGSLVTTGKLLTNLTVPCNNAATLPTLSRSVRHIRVYVDPTAGAEEVLSPDMRLEAVPSALVAETVQGLGKSSLLQVSVADNLSQNNLQSIFTGTNFTKLTDLINGSSAQYVLPSGSNFVPTAAISFNAQRITNVSAPVAGTDATNKTYVDSQIGGRTVSATIATIGAGDAGKVLQWDGTQWVAATATDATKLPLAGGTMTGDITMGGNDIFNAGHITMNPNFYLQLSSRATNPAGLTAGHEGVMWYDSVADVIKYWDGDSVETVGGSFTVAGSTLTNGRIWVGNGSGQAAEVPVSGDATLANTGALTIANDAITNAKMADNAVNTNELANSAVTTAKIADANITPAKLAASSAAGRLPIVNGTNTAFDWMSCAADQTLNWDAVLGFVCETSYTFGTGDLLVARQNAGAGGGAQIRLQSNSGTNSVILKAPDGLASDLTFRFPATAGANGNVLTTDGSGGLSWSSVSSGGVSTVDTFDTTSTANGLSISGANIKLHAASATHPGAVTTGAQTFAGAKTFSGAALFSTGSASNPSISFSGDPDTGIYTGISDFIHFAAGGVKIFDMDGNASVSRMRSDGPVEFISDGNNAGANGGFQFNQFSNQLMKITHDGRVSIAGTDPVASAALDIVSTTRGLLIPRMTAAERDAISSPATGLQVYNTTTNALNFYNGTAWTAVATGSAAGDVLLGGNTVGATMVLGTNSNHALELETNGTSRLRVETSGDLNIFNGLQINGSNAIRFPTSDSSVGNSIAIGPNTLAGQTTSSTYSNIAIGANSLDATMTTAAQRNIAVGIDALTSVTSGRDNVAIGQSAAQLLTVSEETVIIGSYAGASGASYGVVALGANACNGSSCGWENTAVGNRAMYRAGGVTGQNVAIGAGALSSGSYDTATRNVSIGAGSGNGVAAFDFSNNVFVGYDADSTAGTTTKSIAIGDAAKVSGSNQLNIGNAIYGLNILPSSGQARIGIGNSSPAATAILDLTSTTLGLLIPRMTTAERDAITSPAQGLQVYNTTTNALNYFNGTVWTAVVAGSAAGDVINGGNTVTSAMVLGTNSNHALELETNGSTKMTLLADGKVGIGTPTPRSRVDIGGGSLTGRASVDNAGTTIDFSQGNLQHTSLDCQAFVLHHLKDGGSYVFTVKGTNSATCSFTGFSDAGGTPLTVRLPPNHSATTSGKHTVYNLMVQGPDVYVSWIPGY